MEQPVFETEMEGLHRGDCPRVPEGIEGGRVGFEAYCSSEPNSDGGWQLHLEFEPALTVVNEFFPDHQMVMLQTDAREACSQLPDELFSLIITSPPYNIGKSYETRAKLQEYLDWQAPIIEELVRILKPTGSLCWQVGNYVKDGEVFPLDIYFYPIFKELGLKMRNRVVWHFNHGLHASRRFSGRYETLMWFTKSDDYVFNLDPVRIPAKYPGKTYFKGPKRGKPSGNPLGKNPSDFWELLAEEWETGIWEIPNVKSGSLPVDCW